MRYYLLAAVFALACLVQQAPVSAALVFDTNGAAAGGVISVNSFDWNIDSGLADAGMTAARNFLAGAGSTEFDTFAHARLSVFNLSAGGTLDPAGEFTFVAGYRESVSVVVPGGVPNTGTLVFGFVPTSPNFFEIYYDPVNNANPLTGLGYNDGQLILKGNVTSAVSTFTISSPLAITPTSPTGALDQTTGDPAPLNDYPGLRTVAGTGGTTITGDVIDFDSNFFLNFPTLDVVFSIFSTLQATPFTAVDPSASFYKTENLAGLGTSGPAPTTDGAGSGAASLGDVNGALGQLPAAYGGPITLGPDFQFQQDGLQSFVFAEVVPEPSAVAIWSIGALLLAGRGMRGLRRKK